MKTITLAALTAIAVLAVPAISHACTAENVIEKIDSIATTAEYQAIISKTETEEDLATIDGLNAHISETRDLAIQGDTEEACASYEYIKAGLGISPESPVEEAPAE